ncbi:MAG: putative S-layer protein, partial [Paenibacillus sp.]|nr:putative S-layer protein [Paenibacillus sp.]
AQVKLFKRTSVLLLALLISFSSMAMVTSVFAAEITSPSTTVLQNDFIKVTVDNHTGRFSVRTIEGQPIRKQDQNVNMLFGGDNPETSFTSFRIDGTDYIFGNPYKFAVDFFSEITQPRVVYNTNGTRHIETTWKIKGVEIKQILMLYSDPNDKLNAGNVNIRYEVMNNSGVQVEMGTRVLLDTMVAGNDGPQFQIGTAYKVPLMVERKLIHNPEDIPEISEEDRALYKLPPYWVMRDTLELTNPLATNVMAYGFNNFAENNVNLVDEMIVGHWNGLANTKWDYTPNGNLDFTRDTNDYGTADSAVAFYWQPKALAHRALQTFETVYGLGELIEPDKVFSIRFMDTPQQLATLEDNSDYSSEGVFDITAEIENLAMFDMEHEFIDVELSLESGLNFVKLDALGNIVRDNGKVVTEAIRSKVLAGVMKTATPEEAEHGITPMYKPGEAITVTFKVQAKGKAWPTTKQYMMTARSPQTQAKIAGIEDEGTRAQYESVKSNFILLPAVGEAVATYAYGLSPKELFSSDVKYITANLTNIDAYNAGSVTTEPNFDLYIREKVTSKRYKVPVKESVILQAADDGFSGDMRITYRGGDLVDKAGNVLQAGLGPDLPLGEYQLEIDFKGDTGGDEEIAALYDITTGQTFKVTDNQKTRIREAGIMAVYKQNVDLRFVTNTGGQYLQQVNAQFPGKPFDNGTKLFNAVEAYRAVKAIIGPANNALDPKFKLDEFMSQESLKEVPAYAYRIFESEQQFTEFFNKVNNPNREMLVEIRGMIKQVGSGADEQVIVDTRTEPAIINKSVAYKGKDMVFVKGQLDVFGIPQKVNGYKDMPFFDTLFVKGDGTLRVAGSGYTFHEGEWTLDFYNGFKKSLGQDFIIDDDVFPMSQDNEEDNSLNGTLSWAVGSLGDRLNPLRQLMIENIYFNKQSLFAAPNFMVAGFALTFNDFILRPGGISFGGKLSMNIMNAEARNIIFNDKGFVGIDAKLKFDLDGKLGLIERPKEDKEGTGGEIYVTHYVQPVPNVSNRYGVKFHAELKDLVSIQAELAFKQVSDGRVLPDVIAFGTTLPQPGVLITAGTYLTAVRGAVRELADTIAGGTKKDPFPLTLMAGVGIRFGVAPAYFHGSIDLTLKRTGIKLLGKMEFSTKADASGNDLVPMLTRALLEAQWVTPWFLRAEAEIDIGGWDVVIGKAGIFVGQNLEKKRIDFEGYLGASVQIPKKVPVVGGMPLASVFFGVNNDKVWGSVGILLISVGITYYWGGGVEFGTSGESLPDGLIHMVIEDPERGPRLMVIGQGIQTVATSWLDTEKETHEIVYREVADGVSILDNGMMGVGVGGITVKNSGRVHEIPMSGISGNAIIEMEYTETDMPSFTLKDSTGTVYPVVIDNTNSVAGANAFTQHITAAESDDQVDTRKMYVIVPKEKTQAGGTWTLAAVSPVATRLLNVPTTPELTEAKLTPNISDANKFTASWKVDNAKQGDKVSLYLTKEAISGATTILEGGNEVLDPGDAGVLIAKDVAVANEGGLTGTVTNGSQIIDVTQVSMLGEVEDIRGLLQQGHYYLRAELQSDANYSTKTSIERFEIIDPLAPAAVSEVNIQPAGNGYFELSFKPSQKKQGHADFEHSYVFEALQEAAGELAVYPNFEGILFTEEELAPYWNAQSGKYEGIPVGGWTALSSSSELNDADLSGTVLDLKNVQYSGLQTGQEYVIGVTSTTKPTKAADKNENYHFSSRTDSLKKLLPEPALPRLTNEVDQGGNYKFHNYMDYLTNRTEQSITLYSDQKDIEVEAYYAEQSIGKVSFTNTANGSKGTFEFNSFKTDGSYGIELRAENKSTKDVHTSMLYLNVDRSAPILYIDNPLTGARTTDGKIQVSGTTSNDAVLKVNGQTVPVAQDGKFNSQVTVSSSDPAAELVFLARDGAGNENTASVVVTNDNFDVPVALGFRSIPALEPGKERKLEPYLRVTDGKDGNGKPKFKEMAIPSTIDPNKLKYSIYMGDAVDLSADGTIRARAVGASLIQAEYTISDGVTLQGMLAASVEVPPPATIGSITAYTSPIQGNSSSTKLNISSAGDLTGQQLVYKV